jgi:hypothetical protein
MPLAFTNVALDFGEFVQETDAALLHSTYLAQAVGNGRLITSIGAEITQRQ